MTSQERPPTAEEKHSFKPYFAVNVIAQTRVIDGNVPFWPHKKMCAVVL